MRISSDHLTWLLLVTLMIASVGAAPSELVPYDAFSGRRGCSREGLCKFVDVCCCYLHSGEVPMCHRVGQVRSDRGAERTCPSGVKAAGEPVCGSDGRIYDNPESLAKESCERVEAIKILSLDDCDSEDDYY